LANRRKVGRNAYSHLYKLERVGSDPLNQGAFVAFRPNYRGDRAERDRSARARTAEKLKRREEKSAQRKALRAAAEAPEQTAEQDTGQLTENEDKGNTSVDNLTNVKSFEK
jgi:hypothetical protein